MNYRGVVCLLGRLLFALAVALLFPAAVALYAGTGDARAFLMSAGIAGGVGLIAARRFRRHLEGRFGRSEAFVLVTVTWVMASVFGALPYILIKGPGFIVDGIFEAASGFSTTGASIIDDVEAQSAALLLWRSLTQWLGGMGIIVLGIAVLPRLAIGGMELLEAEAPGPTAEKLTPRIAQTAKALWGIYALLTAVLAGLLALLGMTPFDAVNHALTTLATGGFSTRNTSLAGDSSAIQMVVACFMLLAGVNFALHFHMLRGRPLRVARDAEFRFYVGLIGLVTLMLTGDLLLHGVTSNVLAALKLTFFQCLTIVTTTGYATADFDQWPHFSRVALFLLMFVGGCAGSTGGSVKIVRILIVFKKLGAELQRISQPHGVFPVRLGRRAVPDEVVSQVTTFYVMFIGSFGVGGLLLALTGMDPVTAFSASATCLGNIGPGFGEVGPTHTFSQVPVAAKLVLTVLMIVGRLELYTVFVALHLMYRQARPVRGFVRNGRSGPI